MSIKQMSQVWEHPAIQDGTTMLVLLALADWANDDGVCWPSTAKIAKRAKVSERQVRRILDKLNGIILPNGSRLVEIEENRGRKSGSVYSTNRYTLNLTSCPVYFELKPVTGDLENLTSEPVNVTSGTPKPDIAMSTEPSRTTTKNQPPVEPASAKLFNSTECGFQLAHVLGLSGRDMRDLCRDAVENAMLKLKLNPEQSRDLIAEKWQEYDASQIEFKVGMLKYLKTGEFLKGSTPARPLKWKTVGGCQ